MYVLEAAWPLARAPAYGGDGGAGGANSCPAGGGAGSSFGAAGGGGKFNTSLSPLLAAAPGGGAGVACGAVATLMRGNALARTCVRGKPDAHDGDTPPPLPPPKPPRLHRRRGWRRARTGPSPKRPSPPCGPSRSSSRSRWRASGQTNNENATKSRGTQGETCGPAGDVRNHERTYVETYVCPDIRPISYTHSNSCTKPHVIPEWRRAPQHT